MALSSALVSFFSATSSSIFLKLVGPFPFCADEVTVLPFSCLSFVATTGSDDALFGGRFLVPLVTIFFLAGFVSVAAATAAGVDDGGGNVLVDDFGVVVLCADAVADVGWEVVGDDIVCITPFVSLLFFPLVLFVLPVLFVLVVVIEGMDAICVGKQGVVNVYMV